MTRLSLLAVIIIVMTGLTCARAQGRMSAGTRLALQGQHAAVGKAMSHDARQVRAFIAIDSPEAIGRLQAMGVRVHSRFGELITATVPMSVVPQVCRLSGVRQLSVAQLTQVCNDSALADAHVVPLAGGVGFDHRYDGTGVVVGVIDTGVDFNHINLCDPMGRSRVVAAYLPQDSTGIGSAPIIDGDTLPGKHYDTPQLIAQLTTGDVTESHGTHTTGTAAGSCVNGMQGVATGSHLVICAMHDLWDTDIANSLRYIFDYADRHGLPAVVNMSFASSDGPHDGTSVLCQVFDQLSGPGRLISLSAHNSGFSALHLTYNFKTATDTLSTTLERYGGSFNNAVSFWSSTGHRHSVAVMLIDKTERKVVIETPFFTQLAADSVLTLDADADSVWRQYATGQLQFATAVEDGDRSHSILVTQVKPHDTSRYRMGVRVVSDCDPKFNAWVSGGSLFKAVLSGQTGGTRAGTISDLCTGEKPISVGAYITKQTYPLASGGTHSVARATPMHDIAYFTAWGPDARGKARPDICAPGMVTISSASRYDTISSIVGPYNLSFIHTVDGVGYPYGACYGTSMSAPVMTGTLALWLQAKPDLSPDEVRDILDHTARRDLPVTQGDARQWGRGKLDALAGMRYLLRRIRPMDVNADGTVDVADVNLVINIMLGKATGDETQLDGDVTGDGIIDVADVNAIITAMLGKAVTGQR